MVMEPSGEMVQFAEGFGFGAGLAQEHVLPGSILHGAGRLYGMGVAVQHDVDAGGIGNHFCGRPRGTLPILPQVRQCNHIIGLIREGGVYGFLYLIVELLAIPRPGRSCRG